MDKKKFKIEIGEHILTKQIEVHIIGFSNYHDAKDFCNGIEMGMDISEKLNKKRGF